MAMEEVENSMSPEEVENSMSPDTSEIRRSNGGIAKKAER
jgi:hypothetical protein